MRLSLILQGETMNCQLKTCLCSITTIMLVSYLKSEKLFIKSSTVVPLLYEFNRKYQLKKEYEASDMLGSYFHSITANAVSEGNFLCLVKVAKITLMKDQER